MSNIYEAVNGNTQYYELSANAPVEVDGDCEDLLAFVLEREDLAGLTSGGQEVEHFNGGKPSSRKTYSLAHMFMLLVVVALIIMFLYVTFSNCDGSSSYAYNNRPSFQLLSPDIGHDFRATFVH